MVASASAPPVPAAGVGAPSASRTRTPTLRLERRCWGAGEPVVVGIDEVGRGAWAGPVTGARGGRGGGGGEPVVVGIDEVGRGAWAGPVTVAALVPPPDHLRGVRDSKELVRGEGGIVAHRGRGGGG